MTEKTYWLWNGGDVEGPFNRSALVRLSESGHLISDSKVMLLGNQQWQSLTSVLPPPKPIRLAPIDGLKACSPEPGTPGRWTGLHIGWVVTQGVVLTIIGVGMILKLWDQIFSPGLGERLIGAVPLVIALVAVGMAFMWIDYIISSYHFRKGCRWYSHGEFYLAIASFDAAIKKNTRFGAAYFNRALAKKNVGDRSGAAQDFAKAHELNPSFPLGV